MIKKGISSFLFFYHELSNFRFQWNNNPGNQVNQYAGPDCEQQDDEDQSDNDRVDIQIFSDSTTYPCQYLILSGSVQPLCFHAHFSFLKINNPCEKEIRNQFIQFRLLLKAKKIAEMSFISITHTSTRFRFFGSGTWSSWITGTKF